VEDDDGKDYAPASDLPEMMKITNAFPLIFRMLGNQFDLICSKARSTQISRMSR